MCAVKAVGAKFLGIDLSTQKIKGIIIDDAIRVVASDSVDFGQELAQYRTESGIYRYKDGMTVTSPVKMWLDAIDLLFEKLARKADLSQIHGISGCGQQHGTVYWSKCAIKKLQTLDCYTSLSKALEDAFTKEESPIWMDSSTGDECQHMEKALGGPLALAQITGSRAFHRFSGQQITKVFREQRHIFDATEHISLVSSFLPTVLTGHFVGIDEGDGGGMNLMDICKRCWSRDCLRAAVDHESGEDAKLEEKLGKLIPCSEVVGNVSRYFCRRFSFSPNCEVVAFTGDNLSSLAGLCLRSGEMAISLGTSDTVFISTDEWKPYIEGHLFRNPVESNSFMGMLCFKNGSFTRNRIRERAGVSTWCQYTHLVAKTPPGNSGNIGFYFDDNEIIPNVSKGDYRFDSDGNKVESFATEIEVRAVLEHQCLAKRLHAERLGYDSGGKGDIIATGGASSNELILQILANVFGKPVYVINIADSAAFGGALRAKHVCLNHAANYFDSSAGAVERRLVAEPQREYVEVYNRMLPKYAELEARILEM
ncbi:hypothetical protein AB6A40_006884 [Gnathostoma spinigerum]|uniref:Xylulose kinase n=1 Tax=Gnathostoma spinigerum TaxID=75299 RepID=A0ABD6EVA5_9BILA